MDVNAAFRKGNLCKAVCITQPEVFTPRNGNKVCKLQISIYGLKQASKSWNIRFNETIKEFDFSQNSNEPCVYKKDSRSAVVFLVLYVDDILIIRNDISKIQSIKIYILVIQEHSPCILGIWIYRDRSIRSHGLSQSNNIAWMLKRFSMEQSKRGYVPMFSGITSQNPCVQKHRMKG